MIRECERAVKCFPCADESSNPFANLSAELPDRNIYLSVNFRRIPNPPHNNWSTNICAAFCESSISQEDADDCARRKTFDCIVDAPPPNPDNPSWPTTTYCNPARTCQTDSQCYTIPSGTVCAFSAIEADAIAQSLCNHRVHDPELTSACSTAPPPAPTPEQPCPAESGSAAPNSLEISSQQSWETHNIDNSVVIPLVSSNPACNPTSYEIYTPVSPLDHPPGNYGLVYLSGHRHFPAPACLDDPSFPYDAEVHMYGLEDEEHNYDVPSDCSLRTYLANNFMPGGFGGYAGCFANQATAKAEISAALSGRTFQANPYPPDEIEGFPHSNTGGDFRMLFQSGVYTGATIQYPDGPVKFRVVQLSGLIPQPRKVAISNYAALIPQFADPAAAASWNGEFPERTVYTSMTVQWAVTAAGAFGGAVLKWTMAHPTSGNSKGWQIDIFSAGGILMYRAFKAIGSTPIGRFHKDSTSTPDGPVCIECVDDSDQPWQPS